MATLSVADFVARWRAVELKERSAAQSHFLDVCAMLGQPGPVEADPKGDWYTFEKGAQKVAGGDGFADVWMRGRFGWEYKGKHKDLDKAYQQLLQYREDLENPPLLVVCDQNRFEIHTNFTNTVKRVYDFDLAALGDSKPLPGTSLSALEVLRAVFEDPDRLRPERTSSQVTEEVAAEFGRLAESLRRSGYEPEKAAHFLMRLLFCLFAEDIGLLPKRLFTKLVETTRTRPEEFGVRLVGLFEAMATGGFFGTDDIAHFDGGLFADSEVLALTKDDMEVLTRACRLDWSSVEPAIFGTLFERSLDPSKRSQLGAHYTSKADILLVVEPVLMAPLRREWDRVRAEALEIIARRDSSGGAGRKREEEALRKLLMGFTAQIASLKVLDPACGSGNFLYVALKQLLDLEKEVITFAATNGMSRFFPEVGPEQLYGIEINSYAQELAQVVVWIGYIQWLHDNGFGIPGDPILKPLGNIQQMDGVLAFDEHGQPVEPEWPEADVIIGNPPFLGGKLLRRELGDEYVDSIFDLYEGRVPHEADYVCYWFEKARAAIESNRARRAGLLATQGIRGGANRRVLERIKKTGDIFWAESDRNWVLDGAAVHVSMVGFDDGEEATRMLNGIAAQQINVNLTGVINLTIAERLKENLALSFMGDTKGGPFDIAPDTAVEMLVAPLNPNGRPNSDVLKPWINGIDIAQRPRGMWIIDFGTDMAEDEAALYELPFRYGLDSVKPARDVSRTTRPEWWLHERPRPEMRKAISVLRRYVATPRVSKHRLFVFAEPTLLPDSALIAICRDDDYFLGLLHSSCHELWARGMGTQLREVESGFRYTPTTTFETYPFPWPPGMEPAADSRVEAVAQAARDLVVKRDAWLNPPGAGEAELKKRTLTNLYNERPTWLELAHRKLDEAVFDAYGWPRDLSDEEILERLLALNLERAGEQ